MRIVLLALLLLAAPAWAQQSEAELLSGNELQEKPAPGGPANPAAYLVAIQSTISDAMNKALSGPGKKVPAGESAVLHLSAAPDGKIHSRKITRASSPALRSAMEQVAGRIQALTPPPAELIRGKKSLELDIQYQAPK